MRRVVADERKRPRVVAADEFEARVLFDWVGEIDEHAIADRGDGAFGERGRNGFGDVEAGEAGLIGALGAVGKGDVDHGRSRAHSPIPIGVSENAHAYRRTARGGQSSPSTASARLRSAFRT